MHKTKRPFSPSANDQAHEQNNVVKEEGEVVDLLQNSKALLHWMELARVFEEFEVSCSN